MAQTRRDVTTTARMLVAAMYRRELDELSAACGQSHNRIKEQRDREMLASIHYQSQSQARPYRHVRCISGTRSAKRSSIRTCEHISCLDTGADAVKTIAVPGDPRLGTHSSREMTVCYAVSSHGRSQERARNSAACAEASPSTMRTSPTR